MMRNTRMLLAPALPFAALMFASKTSAQTLDITA
jgi:hypothetical protein